MPTTNHTQLFQELVKFYDLVFGPDPLRQWNFVGVDFKIKQTGSVNCGVYTLAFSESELGTIEPLKGKMKDRKSMYERFPRHKLSSEQRAERLNEMYGNKGNKGKVYEKYKPTK